MRMLRAGKYPDMMAALVQKMQQCGLDMHALEVLMDQANRAVDAALRGGDSESAMQSDDEDVVDNSGESGSD